MARTVVHCINSISSLAGGVGFALRAICENVTCVKHVIYTCKDDGDSLLDPRIPVKYFKRNGPYSLSYSYSLERGLMDYLKDHPDSLLHIHGLWSGLGYSVNKIRKRNPTIQYIVSPHGMVSSAALQRRRFMKTAMRLFWEDSVMRHASRVHALTCEEEDSIRRFMPGVETFIQPTFVHFPLSRAMLGRIWEEKADKKKTLLYLGRVHETKGLFQLLRELSFRNECGNPVNFHLKIAGFGEPDAIEALKKEVQSNQHGLTYLGPVFGEEKDKLLRSVHGLILPSMTEGLPMTLMEGAAYGLPLLITEECNFHWVDRQGAGKVVSFGRQGIKELIDFFSETDTSFLGKQGLRAYDHSIERYSSKCAVKNWSHFYNNL